MCKKFFSNLFGKQDDVAAPARQEGNYEGGKEAVVKGQEPVDDGVLAVRGKKKRNPSDSSVGLSL